MGQLLFVSNPDPTAYVENVYASVIWRPGVPSSGGAVETWAEVAALVDANEGLITVWVDSTFAPAVVSVGVYQGYARLVFRSYTPTSEVLFADGAQIRNCREANQISLRGAPTTIPFLAQDLSNVFVAREGGQVELQAGATVSAIAFESNSCQIAAFQGGTYVNNSGNPALGLVDVAPGLTVLNAMLAMAGSAGPASYPPNLFQGDATCVLIQIFDSSAQQVPQPNFLGFILALPMSYSAAVVYDDASVTPSTGLTTVQFLLDFLKRLVTGFGNTAARPAVGDVSTGAMFFDTDLGVPVWSDGSTYVRADRTPLIFGALNVSDTTDTRYLYPGFGPSTASLTALSFAMPRSGVLRKMRVRQNVPGGNSNDIVYTLRVNGVPSALSVTIASTATDGTDLVNEVALAEGDLVDVEITKAASIAASPTDVTLSMELA